MTNNASSAEQKIREFLKWTLSISKLMNIEKLKLLILIIKLKLQILILRQKLVFYLVIHHTATARDSTTFESINRGHQIRWKGESKSKLGMYCGYTYLITGDGKIHQARQDTEQGYHCKGKNFNTIGISLTGNFMKEEMSEPQRISLERLLSEKLKQYNLSKSQIKLHRDFKSTLCPGEDLADFIDDYKAT